MELTIPKIKIDVTYIRMIEINELLIHRVRNQDSNNNNSKSNNICHYSRKKDTNHLRTIIGKGKFSFDLEKEIKKEKRNK